MKILIVGAGIIGSIYGSVPCWQSSSYSWSWSGLSSGVYGGANPKR